MKNQITHAEKSVHDNLLDIHDVEPLNETDYPCLQEIRDVLKKYDMQSRFGVTLLHKHFELEQDEVLVESTDVESRVQTIVPVKKDELGSSSAIETSWMLGDGENTVMTACITQCWKDVHGNHNRNHYFVS